MVINKLFTIKVDVKSIADQSKHNFYIHQMRKIGAVSSFSPQKLWQFSVIPDWFILHIWIPGGDDANQRSNLHILLDFHDGSFGRLEDGRLVYIRNADPDDCLIAEWTQVDKARVNVLVYRFHHNVMCALGLKVKRLKDETQKRLFDSRTQVVWSDIIVWSYLLLLLLLLLHNIAVFKQHQATRPCSQTV